MCELMVAVACLGTGLTLFMINEIIEYFHIRKEAAHKVEVLVRNKEHFKQLLSESIDALNTAKTDLRKSEGDRDEC